MASPTQYDRQQLSYSVYLDKVLAGWIGKLLGGVIGAPFENHKQFNPVAVDSLWPAKMATNDDLDIQVVWLEALQEQGLYLTSHDLARFWQDRCAYNYCEYGYFLYNVQRGIAPPLSGRWNNSFFWESEGCPIRSEIWGMICPGNPVLAAEYARLDGQLDHGGVSVEVEQFLSAALARAFLTDDLEKVLAAGLSVIPTSSSVAQAVEEVREICEEHPEPYDAWRLIIRRYGDRDASKAITNHVLLLMSLFLGKMDFKKTIQLCVNSGWDADCTAATAGALIGVMGGLPQLPEDWTSKLGNKLICGVEVRHKYATLTDFTEETCLIGVEMAAVRNPMIEIVQSPSVTLRRPPEPQVTIEVKYPEDPVLWNSRKTPIRLIVNNPFERTIKGQLRVALPSGVRCDNSLLQVNIPPGGRQVIETTVYREKPDSWLPDKNLIRATILSTGREEIADQTFGLGGARQWLVYGPYWDMWDMKRHEVCPYLNDHVTCNPSAVGATRDCYNHYVRPDHPYLEEQKLLREEIPEELPFPMETGEDLITERNTGGFKGQACYYFVRTFRSVGMTGDFRLLVGRTGPYRMWLDGKLIGQRDDIRGWAANEDEEYCGTVTGRPQRLVVKFIRLTDALSFSINFITTWVSGQKQGISYILDSLEDLPSLKGNNRRMIQKKRLNLFRVNVEKLKKGLDGNNVVSRSV
ncbi:MAG: ADP-ribosylglycohydrolase family protein [Phycisphaerae bacterium]